MGDGRPAGKIVFVNRYFSPDESATSRMLTDLAVRLSALGVRVGVVTSRQLYDQPRAGLPAREIVSGVEVHRVATASRGRDSLAGRALDYASFHLAAGAKLATLLSKNDVVVAKTDPPLISIVTASAATFRGALLVNWLQDIFPEVATALGMRALPGWASSIARRTRDWSLRQAAMNVVLGERMRDHVLRLGVEPSRVRTIANWADVHRVAPLSTADSSTRRRLRLDRRFVIGYSGNLGRAHEFSTLLEAARSLRAARRFVFLITGGGAKIGGLRQAIESEGLDNFVLQPYQPPELLSDSLAAADVHLVSLLPALEGLIVPSKLYGILAAGRPAVFIGDRDGEVARVIRRHDCGVVVPVGSGNALAAELLAMADEPARCAQMGLNGRLAVIGQYSVEHAVSQWMELLGEITPRLVPASAGRASSALRTDRSGTGYGDAARSRGSP